MEKNKGSFWKNNIKKIKKERKERSIKQEAKKKEARIKAEAQKKAKEEIERKEAEAKRIREAKEEAERKEIQKTYEKVQRGEIRKHELLLDTNIIFDVLTNNKHVITKLKNYEGGNNLLFLILRRIIIEFQNMMKDKFDESVQYDKVIEKLSLLGEVKEVGLEGDTLLTRKAKEIERSGKYKNETTGVVLSVIDRFLLQHAIENSYILVTDDRALINATRDNGGDVFNPREP